MLRRYEKGQDKEVEEVVIRRRERERERGPEMSKEM